MKTEILRKFFHILFGSLFLLLIYYFGTNLSLKIIIGLFIIGLIIAIFIKKGFRNEKIDYLLELVERDHEKHFPGKAALLFFLSMILLLYFFVDYQTIVIASFGALIFADSFAAIIGKKFGKTVLLDKKNYKKTLEGTITCFIISLIWLSIFFPLQIAIVATIAATIVEFLPINDNLSMPLVVSIIIKLLF